MQKNSAQSEQQAEGKSKRDKSIVRPGYGSYQIDNLNILVPDALDDLGLVRTLLPDISQAIDMPGGVRI